MSKQALAAYTNFDQLPVILSVENLAAVLGIARVNAYELVHQKDFPKLVINRRILIPKNGLLEWISSNSNGGTK